MDLGAAYALATSLLAEHGLDEWGVEFDRAKSRAGVCRFDRRVIGLSARLTRLHTEDDVRETVLHEIAHALVGPRHGHDAVWRRTALAIGSTGERCLAEDTPRVRGAWLGVCPAGHTLERHRRPERVTVCGLCAPTFDLAHVFEWTHHGRPAPMHPNYLAELAAIRNGDRAVILPVGARVRVTAPGGFVGRVGTIVKRGRTRYHVRLPEGVLDVVMAGVEPV